MKHISQKIVNNLTKLLFIYVRSYISAKIRLEIFIDFLCIWVITLNVADATCVPKPTQ